MKTLFVFGDAHSFYDELLKALDESGFEYDNPDHILVSLGDLCDRGPKSKEILTFINGLSEERKICIIGNHELLMERFISRGFAQGTDVHNGTMKTVEQISDENDIPTDLIHNQYWQPYKRSWRYYFEVGEHIFVHGWIPFETDGQQFRYLENWREASAREFEAASWENGMLAWAMGIREKDKTIYCGHWHTSFGHSHLHHEGVEFPENEDDYALFTPFIDEGIVALDACTVYSHMVNVFRIEVEDKEFEEAIKK